MNHVCDVIESALTAFPQCRCIETTDGTGLIAECDEAVPLIGNVGVRLQLEPCGDPAFAETSYQFGGGGWQSAGRLEADGAPVLFPVPGASIGAFGHSAGLFIAVTVRGNAEDLSVHAHLSVCVSNECDDNIWWLPAKDKFPFPVFEFDDLGFVDECPDEQSDMSMIIIIAAAAGGAILIGLVITIVCVKKRQQAQCAKQQPATATFNRNEESKVDTVPAAQEAI